MGLSCTDTTSADQAWGSNVIDWERGTATEVTAVLRVTDY